MGTPHLRSSLLGLLVLQFACDPAARPAAPPPSPSAPAANPAPSGTAAADPRKAPSLQTIATRVELVERLLVTTPATSPDRPALLRRAAEANVELESAALREQIERETEASHSHKPGEPPGLRAEAERLESVVISARHTAIDRYQALANEYPTFCAGPGVHCGDEALYFLAYEYEQDNQLAEARRVYQILIKGFPDSRYLPHAYVAFGEGLFAEAQSDPSKFALAEKAYQKAAAMPPPENKVWGYAHYKLAFIHWNQGDFAGALSEFKRVIEHGAQFSDLPGASKLAAAARHDILPVYAQAGEPAKAFEFFKPLSGDEGNSIDRTLKMSLGLGQEYVDTGHPGECVLLDLDLLRRAPGGACAVVAQLDQAAGMLPAGGNSAAKAALAAQKSFVDKARSDCPAASVAPAPRGIDLKKKSPPVEERHCAPGDPCEGL